MMDIDVLNQVWNLHDFFDDQIQILWETKFAMIAWRFPLVK